MAERKKKTVHPPLKRRRQNRSKDFGEMENLLKLRINPEPSRKPVKTKRTYQAETTSASLSAGLGLPPLKMVLVHAENDRANATKTGRKKALTQEEAVMKIIQHLTKAK
jgi:hypothetical protein